jgi:hypothetical protein
MMVQHVEVLVEEPSAEAALEILLPRVLGATTFLIHTHQGKNDLLAKLPAKLKAYKHWLPSSHRVLVLIDRDDRDCRGLKNQLERFAQDAGLWTRSRPGKSHYSVVNRVAIEELEAWYFGDWAAVRAAYPRVPAGISVQAKYRDPDAIAGGTWEAFERVLQNAGYFKTGLRKIEAARAIAANMVPERNSSNSFAALRAALWEMAS